MELSRLHRVTVLGFDGDGNPYQSLSELQGQLQDGAESGSTIMEEAIAAGKPTAVIQSGFIAEPGTGVFLADAESRGDREGITAQIVESGADVILGGGETDYLPEGTVGFFGQEGTREDGRNLIEEAEEMGYTVVFTRDELLAVDPAETDKLLGIFAARDTYNDTFEDDLRGQGFENPDGSLIYYGQPGNENPPTIAEMTQVALDVLSQDEDGFMLVAEGVAGIGAGDIGDLDISQSDGNAIIAFGGSDLAVLLGVDSNALSNSNFAFV